NLQEYFRGIPKAPKHVIDISHWLNQTGGAAQSVFPRVKNSGNGHFIGGNEAHAWLKLTAPEAKEPVHLRVPHELLPQAEVIWKAVRPEGVEGKLQLTSAFLKGALELKDAAKAEIPVEIDSEAKLRLVQCTYDQLETEVLKGQDIHAATRQLSNQSEIIRTYYEAKEQLRRNNRLAERAPKKSALLEAAALRKVGLAAEFGGQALEYFGQLREVYETYPEARRLIEETAQAIEEQVRSKEAQELDQQLGLYNEGMDVLGWIRNPASMPSKEYLSSSAVSQSLIGLTQLANYFISL
ncbi:MAG TPA: hypothetical protein DF383_03745, partial [Deltaproteobacteria bacterium]|nr:hypothetical protein [Deltaproteobacteria bacterium]